MPDGTQIGATCTGKNGTNPVCPAGATPSKSFACWTGPGPEPVAIAFTMQPAAAIALGPDRAYWVGSSGAAEGGDGGVWAAPKLANSATTSDELATGRDSPSDVAFLGGSVYWSDRGKKIADYADGALLAVPEAGGTSRALASGRPAPLRIAVDATSVFWLESGTVPDSIPDGAVMSMALDGGTPLRVASGIEPSALVLDDDAVYWTTSAPAAAVFRADRKGGAIQRILDDASTGLIGDLAQDATDLYVVRGSNLLRVSKGGGAPTTVASGIDRFARLAVDANTVHLAEPAQLRRVPKSGGEPTLVMPAFQASAIAADESGVYVASSSSIMRIPAY